ncbi:hypothetical protein BC827DRAFT_1379516 [Russula dissimulans]|nr:hypothetical protein BC827DRAFT_1379516 [Russula dissimulans]
MFYTPLVALLFSSVFTSVFATSCTRTYTVEPGDTCYGISEANDVPSYQLAVLNPGIDAVCDNLIPGQLLCLETTTMHCESTHTVEENDTCIDLANEYHISLNRLYHNNPQLNSECTNLIIGEVVCVDDKRVMPTRPHGLPPTTTIHWTPPTTTLPWCD